VTPLRPDDDAIEENIAIAALRRIGRKHAPHRP
jgi:hypothetical protein